MQSLAATRRLGYRPALDGVRAVAVLAVMAFHAGWVAHPFGSGFYGVDVFFVLSGFLITTLLVEEHRLTGTISLRFFWQRRAARLLPALFVLCGVVLLLTAIDAVGPHLDSGSPRTNVTAAAIALGYASSWVAALTHVGLGPFVHTWSLSVEEWFYLAWPLVLILLLRRTRHSTAVTGGLAAVALVYRGVCEAIVHSPRYLYYAPDQHACQLLCGCALALLVVDHHEALVRRATAVRGLGLAGALGVVALIARQSGTADGVAVAGRLDAVVIALAAAAWIGCLVLVPGFWLSRALACRPLVAVGRRSYGLYLYHYAVFTFVAPVSAATGHRSPRALLIAIVVTVLAAEISYRGIEQRAIGWMRVRERSLRLRGLADGLTLAPAGAQAAGRS